MESSNTKIPMQDDFDEMRRPRSKKYLATVRALRMNYDILAEYEAILEEPVGDAITDPVAASDWEIKQIEIRGEIDLITADIKELEERLTKLMPKGDELLDMIYMEHNTVTLLQRGIISRKGVRYDGVEELCENAHSEQERKALALGHGRLMTTPTPLVVEIFLHVVNQVNADGTVTVFEV